MHFCVPPFSPLKKKSLTASTEQKLSLGNFDVRKLFQVDKGEMVNIRNELLGALFFLGEGVKD